MFLFRRQHIPYRAAQNQSHRMKWFDTGCIQISTQLLLKNLQVFIDQSQRPRLSSFDAKENVRFIGLTAVFDKLFHGRISKYQDLLVFLQRSRRRIDRWRLKGVNERRIGCEECRESVHCSSMQPGVLARRRHVSYSTSVLKMNG